jgi:hypothetical protein
MITQKSKADVGYSVKNLYSRKGSQYCSDRNGGFPYLFCQVKYKLLQELRLKTHKEQKVNFKCGTGSDDTDEL